MKVVIGGALGECVHVAGVSRFLRLAEQAGWQTIFLGPAVSPETILKATHEVLAKANPDDDVLVGVSYRLTPETGERLRKEKRYVQQETVLETGKLFSCRGISLQRLCCRVI